MPKTNVFGHIPASGQFGPNRAPPTHPPTYPPTRAPPTRAPPNHPPTHPPTRAPRMFLGTFRLQPNLVRTAGMPKTNLFGHIRASAQFGPNSRNAKNESFWAHSGFSPIWSEQPECRKRMFLGTFRLQGNLVRTGRHPHTHPPTHPPGRHERFWAHSGFSPLWSEQPESQNRMFLGTFRLQPNLVRTARMPKTNLFGHIRASAQFGPNSRIAEKECFWAHSGFRPVWSEPGATHPPTHPPGRHPPTHPPTQAPPTHPPSHPGATRPPTHPPGRHECFWARSGFSTIWSEQPECQKRIFLGTFGLQPNLVRTAGMPKTNLFGHIRASAQFGPNSRNAENECFWAHSGFRPIWSKPGATHPPTHPGATHPGATHPPTHPPTHPGATNVFGHIPASAQFGPNSRNAKNESFWAHSGCSPIWSEQPECQKRIFLGTFGLQPNLVRTAGMPKTNVFGHIRASGQVGPNRAPPTHPPTHPPGRHPPGRHPPTHPPTHPPGRHECFWARSGFVQFGPNSRNAKNESFWAHSGFSPIRSE